MKAVSFYAVLFAFGTMLNAQSKPAPHLRLSHPLSQSRVATPSISSFRDTARVLAIMVDFPISSDTRITGNGRFMLQSTPGLVDPPPHDLLYFSYKMQFIQNYFKKVSNGKLAVVGTVLNRVLSVSKQMQIYAPSASSNNAELAGLAAESWAAADSAFPGFDFNHYDVFVVFHAGIGHDLNLVNLLGYDPTPLNLPSLYLGPQALKDAFQNQSYDGIPVSGGSFKIDNTIILPETDTQFFVSSQGTADTLQVSINGLFAASIGSYLGLPDLWDTKTGREGIGQYGLEDGASFFAYYGLFPPEPCAWEKIRLGWVTPVTISSTALNIPTPAVSLYHAGPTYTGQDTIYKIPISGSEYFLVENRSRDPLSTGQTLKIIQNGIPVFKSFHVDSAGFTNNDISAIQGSVVDAQNYDWAMLGLIDSTHVYDGGGIFIWHIDENIINAGLATNTVNANPDGRGVYLEEAKGAQDIGQVYSFLDPGSGSENGSPLDAWYLGNLSVVYANRFDRSSIPNSNANSGAFSLVTIKDFSARLPRMTFSVQIGDNYLKSAAGFPKDLGLSISDKSVQTWSNGIYVSKGDSVYVFRSDGTSGTPDTTGLLTSNGGSFLLAFDATSPGSFFVGAQDSSLLLFRVVDVNGDGVYDSVQTSAVNIGHRITTAPTLNGTEIVLGHADGGIVQVDPLTRQISNIVIGLSNPVTAVLFSNCAVTKTAIKDASNRMYSFSTSFSGFAIGQGSTIFLVDTVQRSLIILENNLMLLGQASLGSWQGSISKPSTSDIYHNGDDAVVLTIGNTILGFNSRGFLLDGFPLKMVSDIGNASPVLLPRLASDAAKDILAVSSTGIVSAYSNHGKILLGFPFDIGTSVSGTPAAFPVAVPSGVPQTGFSLMGDDGRLYAYQISANYVAVDSGPPTPISTDFLPASRVYNWPNPVYGSTTHIRFYCLQDANVSISIFDIAGKKITVLNGKAIAGMDTEVAWDVSHIQSGVYLARVEASNQNKTQARIIKIAVVK
jgi:hypothetical protein